MKYLIILSILIFQSGFGQDNSPVSSVKASQRASSYLVDIYFDVIDKDVSKVYIMLEGSSDNGASWNIDIKSTEGDTGYIRLGRGKHIIWHADRDYPRQFSSSFKIKVRARTKMCPNRGDEGMVYVSAGSYMKGEEKINMQEYCIDRWEFPNIRGDYPDVFVTFQQASDSCYSIGKKICTERQWEYACAGKSQNAYPYGPEYVKERCNTDNDTIMVIGANKNCRSEFGVFDLSGNVYEWVADVYREDISKNNKPLPETHVEAMKKRIIRGGNHILGEGYSRCDNRQWEWPKNATRNLGFRCCFTFPTE